jgi:hypothetical protein
MQVMIGTIVITSLFGDEKIIVRLPVPANTVAIDPNYAKSPKKQFVYGGHNGSLIVSEEGWFYRSERSLHDGSGAVLAAKVRVRGLSIWRPAVLTTF